MSRSESSVQLLSHVQLFVIPWTAARQASLAITNSRSLLKLMSIESVMTSNHLILCHPLLPPSIFPSIRGFSNESVLHIRWPKYGRFSFSITPSNEHSGLISFRIDWSTHPMCNYKYSYESYQRGYKRNDIILFFFFFFAFLFSQDLPLIDYIKIRAAWLRHVTQFAKADLTALAKRQLASLSLSLPPVH